MKRNVVAAVAGMSALAAFMCGCASTAEKLTEKANLGDTAAQWQLAELYMTGQEGAPCNPSESKRWLEKSIEGDNVDALALKGEFEADGRYGEVPTETVLSHLYPAIKQNQSGRAGAQYLKVAMKANDVDHIPQCTEAIVAVYEGPRVYREQTSLTKSVPENNLETTKLSAHPNMNFCAEDSLMGPAMSLALIEK